MMIRCPICNEAEFYYWQPGYGAWCERCGYGQDAEGLGKTQAGADEEPHIQEGR